MTVTLDCTVEPGTQLGPYEIKEPLGAGGMGEVYRARDTKLDREVAIKVLPAELADDPERLARLEREARLLASLNHPNVGSIYGLEETDEGRPALVLELVEGPTLADRIRTGPVPVEEALGIALQIAEALEVAHERGIIHRDLKPANVKVTGDGMVKVLDFGLAKAVEGEQSEQEQADSPTLSAVATQAGVILGTAGYMSPEQAKGKEVDWRADIWSFGVVLMEMLSGERAFEGETVSETLAAVIKDEPDLDGLPSETPVRVRDLLQRCLEKDSRRRLQAVGEARIALEAALAEPESATLATALRGPEAERARASGGGWRRALPWTIAVLAVAAAVAFGFLVSRSGEDRSRSVAFQIEAATEESPFLGSGPSMVLSPDGNRLAIVTGRPPNTRLHLRSLDQLEPIALPRTEGAQHPFFSPDGRWIGFFTGDSLKKIAVTGGAPITLCEVESNSRGGSWGEDGTIVFAPSPTSGLARVSASGGEPETITTPDPEREGNSHRWPQILPGGDAVVFIAGDSGDFEDARVMAVSLETREVRTIHRGAMYARYLPTGHLVYVHQRTLFAAGFDADRLEMLGTPVPVLEEVIAAPGNAGAQYSVSDNGTLVYIAGFQTVFENTVHWAARDGELSPLIEEPGSYWTPAVSPDGSRLAVSIGWPPDEADIWVRDLERGTMTRLTFDAAGNMFPVWSPNGRWIAYASGLPTFRLRVKRADGVGEARRVSKGDAPLTPMDWSPDGRTLIALNSQGNVASPNLHLLSLPEGVLEGETAEPVESEPFLATEFVDLFGRFSPDGGWVAYQSDESGQPEIYVRPYRRGGGKWQISTDGGHFPTWSTDGTELFYLDEDRIMAVPYTIEEGSFSAGQPTSIVELPFSPTSAVPIYLLARIDSAPDDERFVVLQSANEERLEERVTVVLDWFEELKRQVPTGQ